MHTKHTTNTCSNFPMLQIGLKHVHGVANLTAVLARTFALERGIKPVKSVSVTTPIGQTEWGSYPKTTWSKAYKLY